MQIEDVETAKQLWEAIKTRYVGASCVKEAKLQTLMAKFDRLRMSDSESVDSFTWKLFGIASKATPLVNRLKNPIWSRNF